MLPVFLRSFTNAVMLFFVSKVRDSGKRFVERQRAKETINGGSHFIDELLLTGSVQSLFLADVQKLFRKTFSSSFDISSIGFENLVPPGLASHSVTLTLKIVVAVT